MKVKVFGLLIVLLMLAGCGNGNTIVNEELSDETKEIIAPLNAMVLKYKVQVKDKDHSTLRVWIEKYNHGKKVEEDLASMEKSYDGDENPIDEYVVIFSQNDLSTLETGDFNIQFYASDKEEGISTYTDTILSKNDTKESISSLSWSALENLDKEAIEPNKVVNLGFLSLEFGDEEVRGDVLELYDDKKVVSEKLNNRGITYLIRAKFTNE